MQSSRLQPTGCRPRPATCPNPFFRPRPNPFFRPGASGPAPGPAKAQLRPVPQAQRQPGCPEAEKPRLDLDISSRRPWLTTLCKRAVNAVAGCTAGAFGFVSHAICQDTGFPRSSVVCQASSDSEGSTSGAGLPKRGDKATPHDGSGGAGSPGPDAQAALHDEPRDLSKAMVDNLQLEQPSKGDDAVVAAFQRLVDRTARPGVKDVLMLNQAKLVKEEVTSEEALQGLTLEELMAFKLSKAAATALKEAFPSSTATGEPPPPAAVAPVQRRRVVKDKLDPNVLRLHDALSHKRIKNQFVIDPMVKHGGQEMRASEVLTLFAKQAQQNLEDEEVQTPLLVSGPIKSGKSYTAQELLPAVVHTTFEFDYSSAGNSGSMVTGTAPKPPAPIFLYVSCLDISRGQGVAGFFRGLLKKLKSAAQRQGLAAAVTPFADDDSAEAALEALMDFYSRLPRDRITFVTLDEAQSFFLLVQQGPEGQQKPRWNEMEIEHMRRSFKSLVTSAPFHVVPVVTGSTMASVWANFALTPTNGLALLTHNFTLHLPGYADAGVMTSTWQQLGQRYKQPPAALRAQTMPGHALLIWLVKEWVQSGRKNVSDTYVLSLYQAKLFPEILADLKVVAEALGASDPEGTRSFAKHLLNLLDCNVGCSQEALRRTGMLAFLGDELQAAALPGHVWVQSPVYMTMLQLAVTTTGELQFAAMLKEPTVGDYARLWTLANLGEVCSTNRRSVREPRNRPLLTLLQQLVTDLNLNTQQIYGAKWYQDMLNKPACNYKDPRNPMAKSAREGIVAGMQAGRMDEIDLLVGYCYCIRHVIIHSGGKYQWWLLEENGCVPQLLHLVRTGQVNASLAAL